jgi:hypothetical protein
MSGDTLVKVATGDPSSYRWVWGEDASPEEISEARELTAEYARVEFPPKGGFVRVPNNCWVVEVPQTGEPVSIGLPVDGSGTLCRVVVYRGSLFKFADRGEVIT